MYLICPTCRASTNLKDLGLPRKYFRDVIGNARVICKTCKHSTWLKNSGVTRVQFAGGTAFSGGAYQKEKSFQKYIEFQNIIKIGPLKWSEKIKPKPHSPIV